MSDHEPKLSAELRVLLCQVFTLGYCDQMAGFLVNDNDLIASVDAAPIATLALACIAGAEDEIHANYAENPQQVHDQIYHAGRLAYRQAESLWMQRN